MFGYIRVNKLNLLVRDYFSYRTCYCYLCNELGKNYGILSRMFLNYDITFLTLCLDGLEKEQGEAAIFRCPFNPFRKMSCIVSKQAIEYSAFINYYLAIQKINDDIIDEGKWFYRIVRYFLLKKHRYKSMCALYREQLQKLDVLLEQFNQLEQKESSSFDELTNAMGLYFAELFSMYLENRKLQDEQLSKHLRTVSMNLGKWVYLMDAYEDYETDRKKGRFNLLTHMMEADDSENQINTHRKVQVIHQMMVFQMHNSLKEIIFEKNARIIKNIVEEGCFATYKRITKKKYPHIAEQFWPEPQKE